MRSLFLTSFLVLATPVHAALVDSGSFVTDTNSGLDWLDLSLTTNMTIVEARFSNQDWRLPTNAEVESLFGEVFAGFFPNAPGGTSSASGATTPPYAGHDADILEFIGYFGLTDINDQFVPSDSLGMYFDEGNTVRIIGVRTFAPDPGGVIFGLEQPTQHNIHQYEMPAQNFGTFLVRTTAVPVPAAVWLFGSALAGLGWMRQKQAV